jgi:hypothetical protein
LQLSLFVTLPQVGNETLLKSVAQATIIFIPETHPANKINTPSQKGSKPTTLRFAFDASYSSMEGAKPLATQAMLFDNVGRFALDNALKGEFRYSPRTLALHNKLYRSLTNPSNITSHAPRPQATTSACSRTAKPARARRTA